MPSDIPKNSVPPFIDGPAPHRSRNEVEAENERKSFGLDALNASEDTVDIDDSLDNATDFEDFDGGAAFLLMPHERKLPIAAQRQIVMARRKTDDDDDEQREIIDGTPLRRRVHRAHQDHQPTGLHNKPKPGAQPGSITDESVPPSDGSTSATRIPIPTDVITGGGTSNLGGTDGGSRAVNTDVTASINAQNPALLIENNNSDGGANTSTGGGAHAERGAAPLLEAVVNASNTGGETRNDTATGSNTTNISDGLVERIDPRSAVYASAQDKGVFTDSSNASTSGTGGTGGGTHIENRAAAQTEAVSKTDRTTAADSTSGGSKVENSAVASPGVEPTAKSDPLAANTSIAQPTSSTAHKTDKPAATDPGAVEARTDKPAVAATDFKATESAPVAAPPPATTPTPTASMPGSTTLLNDARNPNNALFNTTLQGVNALDPSKVQLTRAEAVMVAGALTASITNTPGFDRTNPSAANISIAASQSGERVFAINNQNPGAVNAIHTSVDVSQTRNQELSVSSAQSQPPLQTTTPVQLAASPPQVDNPATARGIA